MADYKLTGRTVRGMATPSNNPYLPKAEAKPQGTGLPSLQDMFKGLGLSGAGSGGGYLPTQTRAGLGLGGGGGVSSGSSAPSQGSSGPGAPSSNGSIPQGQFSLTASQNPQLAALAGDYQTYQGKLAAGSDKDATLAMQRQRDAMSGMAKEFGEGFAQQGTLGSGAAQQALMEKIVNPGQASLGQLNAGMASDARAKQLQVLGGRGQIAGQQAAFQQSQQQLGLDAWKAQQQNEISRAQTQAMAQNQQMNQMLSLVGLLGNMYSGF